MPKTAAVLGAGMQGCCAALALSKLGFQVTMYDKAPRLYSRASANQEGKIHLGFVYARDKSLMTARTMIKHAMQFGPAIESFVGVPLDWRHNLSERFHCAIHKTSSLTMDMHYAHFRALQDIYLEIAEGPDVHYLGSRPKQIWSETESQWFRGEYINDIIETAEQAVHPGWMRNIIVQAVERDVNISCFSQHVIQDVNYKNGSISIRGQHLTARWSATADVVINCLWEGRTQIDRAMGMPGTDNWITRVKYGFVVDSIPELNEVPSLIITHGPFGDIVNYKKYGQLYITWYPECLSYFGNGTVLPEAWEEACNGVHPEGHVSNILAASMEEMNNYLPGILNLKLRQVMAGTIMGQGHSDISDADSGLHNRHDIGVTQSGNYYSIFTGKFTSAPANAKHLQGMLS